MIKKISIADKETLDIINTSVSDNKNTLSNMNTSMNNLNAKVDDLNSNVAEIKKNSNSGIGCVAGLTSTVANADTADKKVLDITGAGVITCIAGCYNNKSVSVDIISLQIDGANKKYLLITPPGAVVLSIRFNESIIVNSNTESVIVSYELFE